MKQASQNKPANVNEYVAAFPKEMKLLLNNIRKTIKAAAPKAEEVISYGMAGYRYHGMLVYFAGWKNHIGFYPTGALKAFEKELSGYEVSKGTIRFPSDKPVPLGLLSKIVKYRVKENEARVAAKRSVKTKA